MPTQDEKQLTDEVVARRLAKKILAAAAEIATRGRHERMMMTAVAEKVATDGIHPYELKRFTTYLAQMRYRLSQGGELADALDPNQVLSGDEDVFIFKRCPRCKSMYHTLEEFRSMPSPPKGSIMYDGVSRMELRNCDVPMEGTEEPCGTTLAIPVTAHGDYDFKGGER